MADRSRRTTMEAPFTFINTYAVKEGQLEGLRQFLQELFKVLEANEPRLLAINAYLNQEGTEVAIVQIHPDAASIKDYWRVVHQHTGRALGEFLEGPTSVQVYGAPGELVLERTRHSAGSGIAVSLKPRHLGGLTRLAAAAG